jgi:hypothetical protein
MSPTESLDALRRANPRHVEGFTETMSDLTRKASVLTRPEVIENTTRSRHVKPANRRWRRLVVPAGATLVAMVMILASLGSPVGPLAVPPADAMQQAVNASASAAETSGTVDVQITKDGAVWAAKTISWNGADLSVTGPGREGRGNMLVVNGIMYGDDPEDSGGWLELGPLSSVDPESGTTPEELLQAVAEDAGGATMERLTAEMTDLTTRQLDDGSTVYAGSVLAGTLARETGVKEGETLRVLPYGYVAHDDASNPQASIDVSIVVGADGKIHEILASWGGESEWTYRLGFSGLGTTPAIEKPSEVRSLKRSTSG